VKANLMFHDRDLDLKAEPVFGKSDLMADLELKRLLSAMSGDDKLIAQACETALFCPLTDNEGILYRQAILRDAMENSETVRSLYKVCLETEALRRGSWRWLSTYYLSSTYNSSIELLSLYTAKLMDLRLIADRTSSAFHSEGFLRLFALMKSELSDEYFALVREHLKDLKDKDGTMISARFGNCLQGVSYVLRRKNRKGFWRRWTFAPSYTLAPRDDSGATDLSKRNDRAINEATNALAQAAEHLQSFFNMLRAELAFYIGCLNLRDALDQAGASLCIPNLGQSESRMRSWKDLYDVSLALLGAGEVVSNTLESDKRLYIITGANQGGKTTFLRSLGQAQLMAQCGMPVGAMFFSAPVRLGLFTHFKREEDVSMKSGKLDEELARMSRISDHLRPGALVLLNESFSATNEREGSEICGQITRALRDNEIEVFSVSHLYAYAVSFSGDPDVQFLRAQRLDSGERTYKILPGEPLVTAHGDDLYRKIFMAEETESATS